LEIKEENFLLEIAESQRFLIFNTISKVQENQDFQQIFATKNLQILSQIKSLRLKAVFFNLICDFAISNKKIQVQTFI
jgi:hypothetical protein